MKALKITAAIVAALALSVVGIGLLLPAKSTISRDIPASVSSRT